MNKLATVERLKSLRLYGMVAAWTELGTPGVNGGIKMYLQGGEKVSHPGMKKGAGGPFRLWS